MKKCIQLFLLFCLVAGGMKAQPCPSGDFSFTTQEEVDSFLINYPNCTKISGSLSLLYDFTNPIYNLDALGQLTSIGGDLLIKNQPFIQSLTGLDALETVGGTLEFDNNSGLDDFDELAALKSVGGDLIIEDNSNLLDLNGFNALTEVGQIIQFQSNYDLVNINGFNALTTINGLRITGHQVLTTVNGFNNVDSIIGEVYIVSNESLASIAAFQNLKVVTDEFRIAGNAMLTSLSGFSSLETLEGSFLIWSNDSLLDLGGFASLSDLGNNISIKNNLSLQSLSGLESLTTTEFIFEISGNPALTDLNALINLTDVVGGLNIKNNDALEDLTGVNNIASIGSLNLDGNNLLSDLSPFSNLTFVNELVIQDQPLIQNFVDLSALDSLNSLQVNTSSSGDEEPNGLTDFTGLEGLTTLGGIALIGNVNLQSFNGLNNVTEIGAVLLLSNNSLEDFSGLDNVTSIVNFIINNNDGLLHFDGLESLTTIGGYLNVLGNDALLSLSGLNNLATVNEFVGVKNNAQLETLQGLEGLVTVGEGLYVFDNPSITDITALSNADLTATVDSLNITNNPSLSICSQENLCDYIITGGNAVIHDNAPGCANLTEVIQSCFQDTAHVSFVGNVYGDLDQNCLQSAGDIGIPGVMVHLENDTFSYAVSTDEFGNYWLPAFAGEYTLNVVSPSSFWVSCFADTVLTNVGLYDTITTDFLLLPYGACPYLDWNMVLPPMRICESRTIVVDYCNYGALEAEDVIISIDLDTFLTIDSASIPYTVDVDGTLLFEIDTVGLFECGQFTISAFLDCDSVELNDLLCVDVELLSEDLCAPDTLWDGSIVKATGYCENDSIYFELENIGVGDMGSPSQFRVEILIDDIVLLHDVDDFQLLSGETEILSYEIQGTGFRIEADQTPGHPINNQASAIVPNCEDIENNIILILMPASDGDPFSETFCTFATNSFDPNIKTATPVGIGDDHEIDKDWELDYTIQFQNTGNDVAYLVVIKDTLSENLDLTSISVRGASHEFAWSLNPDRELIFTFDNILLPDSTTNEPESHGYVQFSISPRTDILPGEVIENNAGIYFDFNDPIITNTVLHTIRKPIVASSEHLNWCEGEAYQGQIIWQDTTIQFLTSYIEYDSVHFVHFEVLPQTSNNASADVLSGEYFQGVLIENDTMFTISYTGQNGCDSLVTYSISVVVDVNELFKAVEVFPNPVSDVLLVLNHQNGEAQQWSLVNNLGVTIWQEYLSAKKSLSGIPVRAYPVGVYWLKVKTEKRSGVWKVVIQ